MTGSEARKRWQARWRSRWCDENCAFQDIYLDDGFGLTCLGEEDTLRGAAPGRERQVSLPLEVRGEGVGATLFPILSRPEVHLAIVRKTFQAKGTHGSPQAFSQSCCLLWCST